MRTSISCNLLLIFTVINSSAYLFFGENPVGCRLYFCCSFLFTVLESVELTKRFKYL